MQGQASTFGARRSTFIARRLSSPARHSTLTSHGPAPRRCRFSLCLASTPSTPRSTRSLTRLSTSSPTFPPPLAHAPHSTHPAEDSTAAGGEGGDGFPTEAEALAKADYGRRLIEYEDLPFDWRNNPFVVSGYRAAHDSTQLHPPHPPTLAPPPALGLHAPQRNAQHSHAPAPAPRVGARLRRLRPRPASAVAETTRPMARVASISARKLGKEAHHTPDPAESLFTLFALLCLLSSALWHTMAGCAHKRAIETCARIDYVGIGWLIAVSVGAVVRWGYGCEAAPLSDVHTTLAVVGGGVGGGQGQGVVKRVLSALGGTLAMQSAFVGPLYLSARLASTVLASAASISAPTAAYVGPAFASACDSLVAYLDSLGSLTSFASVFEYAAASLTTSFASMNASLSSLLATTPTYHPVYSRFGTGSIGWRIGAVAPMASVAFFRGWAVMWQFIAPIVPSLLYYLVGLVIYAAHVPSGGLSATMDAEAYGGAGGGSRG
ncbi:HlyIII-domain-containing protein [Mycena sanguinolenta]|uniref:HlyIII-domain-containing protein n=1 Tax=Mycena sanguinolenta TaxID=230812 RepID=A0A8H6Y5M5_9AGAR|nr:HlyIII-domain-containing protein [Mycena sanguinolenta]